MGFKVGDYVCGCTRLGALNHGSAQELHLRDAFTTIHMPSNLTVPQAACFGPGFQTAAIGMCDGLLIPMPEKQNPKVGQWVLVMGGAGAVGRATVQLLLLAGYDVVTTCSARSKEDLESLGALTVDYKQSVKEQVAAIQKIAGGGVSKIYDATSADDPVVPKALFAQTSGDKLFTTTNDWSGIVDFEGGRTHNILLGPIGRPAVKDFNKKISVWNAALVKLCEAGLLSTNEYNYLRRGFRGCR